MAVTDVGIPKLVKGRQAISNNAEAKELIEDT